jgi:hypothetical protein
MLTGDPNGKMERDGDADEVDSIGDLSEVLAVLSSEWSLSGFEASVERLVVLLSGALLNRGKPPNAAGAPGVAVGHEAGAM